MEKELEKMLEDLYTQKIDLKEAQKFFKDMQYHDIGIANIDHKREHRTFLPEAIYGKDKSIPQLEQIIQHYLKSEINLIATRLNEAKLAYLYRKFKKKINIDHDSGIIYRIFNEYEKKAGKISVIAAGTSDMPVYKEALLIAQLLGNEVEGFMDCGVAGIHRIYDKLEKLRASSVIIVIAGMEGALPTVISGLTGRLVIGVPTSKGYGAHVNGFVPLLSMLNSCSPTVVTVNIDNGFGAACAATSINQFFS